MPARPFAPTNVIRQDIELLDNLKASGNIALYEEARSAVFHKHELSKKIRKYNQKLFKISMLG